MEAGDVFERKYRIERRLGTGGFADVYLATHIEIDQQVAIKLLHKESAEPRFVREGKVLANLRSPHTLRILDFGRIEETGQAYLISEFVDGVPLSDVMKNGPLPWPAVATMMDQVLSSLAEAHTAGVIHRDIKPDNIMQQHDGSMKVLDFGIARVQTHATLTGQGAIIGTPRYMAPEALLNPDFARASVDVYAVGLVAFGLLTGAPANDGESMKAQIARQLDAQPYVLGPSVVLPDVARRWVERMCAKRPDDRPPNAGAALHELRELGRRRVDTTADDVVADDAPIVTSNIALNVLAGIVLIGFAGAFVWTLRAQARTHVEAPPVGEPLDGDVTPAVVRTAVAPVAPVAAAATPEPIDVGPAFDRGKQALDDERWLDAVEAFAEVHAVPDSGEAAVVDRKGYHRRAIEEILDLEPSPQTQQMVARVVELYPDDERAKARLAELGAVAPVAEPAPMVKRSSAATKVTPTKPAGIEIVRDVASLPDEVAEEKAPADKKPKSRTGAELTADIKPQMSEFRPCKDTVTQDTPITLVFSVLASGKTYGARLEEAGHKGSKMWSCVVDVANRLQFREHPAGTPVVQFTVPFTLYPD